jgi:hypothetical protein
VPAHTPPFDRIDTTTTMMNAVISTAKATRILPHAVGRTVALDARSFSTGPSKWAEATPEDQILHNAAAVFQAGLRHHHTANTAYPIAHSKTLSPYRMKRTPDQRFVKDTLREAYGGLDEMMLYVHVRHTLERSCFFFTRSLTSFLRNWLGPSLSFYLPFCRFLFASSDASSANTLLLIRLLEKVTMSRIVISMPC